MKKLTSMILALMMLLALVGCGSERAEMGNNEIAGVVLEEGYYCALSTAEEGCWKGVFQKEDGLGTIYLVEADMSKEEFEAYDSIPYDAEDADEQRNIILTNLSGVTVRDITDKIPTQEELDAYVGKTLGDLEKDGFENSGNSNSDGIYQFFYDGPVYSCTVSLEEGTKIEDMDDYSANDLRQLTIGGVEFTGISYHILDSED